MLEKVHIIITLIAALIVTIVCFVTGTELGDFAFKLCVAIPLFYFAGSIAKLYFKKRIFKTDRDYYFEDDVPPSETADTQKQN